MNKYRIFLFLGLAVIAVLLLMVGLPEFRLRGGQPLSLNVDAAAPAAGGDAILPGGDIVYWLIRGMAALVIVGLPIYVVYSLFSPQGRRRLLAEIIIVLVLVFILDRVSRSIREQPQEAQPEIMEPSFEQPMSMGAEGASTEQFEARTPEWSVWVASIGTAVFLTGVVSLGLLLYYKKYYKRMTPADRLAREAERAVDALQQGGEFKNVIIRCYYQMSQILSSERGIRRDLAMTPSEFEQALEEKGFPSEPIQYLTKIFEEVRYGTRQPDKQEEEKAIWYLTVIAEASKDSHLG